MSKILLRMLPLPSIRPNTLFFCSEYRPALYYRKKSVISLVLTNFYFLELYQDMYKSFAISK